MICSLSKAGGMVLQGLREQDIEKWLNKVDGMTVKQIRTISWQALIYKQEKILLLIIKVYVSQCQRRTLGDRVLAELCRRIAGSNFSERQLLLPNALANLRRRPKLLPQWIRSDPHSP